MVAWEIVEDILKAGVELGILRKVKGIQGEYIDVNPEAVAKLEGEYNLWAFWLAKELGLPKEVWIDAARRLHPNFDVYGKSPAEIDRIRLYLRGKREEAIRLWRSAGVDEETIKDYDLYLRSFLKSLKNYRILEKAKKILEEKERVLAGAPRWFDEYLVGQKIAELERMERVLPDLFEVNVLIPLRTAYRVFDWMCRRLIQKGALDLAGVETYLNKLVRKEGCDPYTEEDLRSEVMGWFRDLSEGRLTEEVLYDRVRNFRATLESLVDAITHLHMKKKSEGSPYTKEEVRLIKEKIRKAAAPLKFVMVKYEPLIT